jgi:hypothetical protein
MQLRPVEFKFEIQGLPFLNSRNSGFEAAFESDLNGGAEFNSEFK